MKKEDIEFMADLKNRLEEDDEIASNRFIEAQPVFYGIMDTEMLTAADGIGDTLMFCDCEDMQTLEDAIEHEDGSIEIGESSNYSLVSFIEEFMSAEGDVFTTQEVQHLNTSCMFLTYGDAKAYLDANRHHHGLKSHIYCCTAWRNPTVSRLWKILRSTDWVAELKESAK